MKKLMSLEKIEVLGLIYTSKKLTDELDSMIQEQEMNYISDLLGSFSSSVAEWSIGFYNRNYISVRDSYGFLQAVEQKIHKYGGSEKLISLAEQSRKLWNKNSNLFEHTVEKLCDELEQEFQGICNFIEDICFKIYQKEVHDDVLNYLNEWMFEDIYVTNDNKLISLEKYN